MELSDWSECNEHGTIMVKAMDFAFSSARLNPGDVEDFLFIGLLNYY